MGSDNRVAVVTGGMGGIGTAICLRLKAEGATVVAIAHSSDEDKIESWQTENNTDIEVVVGDVASEEDAARMMNGIMEKHEHVDILVNCAGITRDGMFKKMDGSQWDSVIATNLNSVYYVTRPVWNGMINQGFGRVINISSVNGQRGQFGQANYAAAKAGMHGITMSLAYEGATKGVTVNTVSPGYVNTSMTAAMRDDVRDTIIAGIPMRRMGNPEEIAAAVAFVADDESAYLTGVNLPVNGGLFIH
jgi:acetoacetyl-CoA reductase